jgi:hypothetical protein
MSYNHIHLSVSEHILFDTQVPALKLGSTETRSWEREEKMGIFLEVTYQKSPKTNPFLEGIIQKTENWHFGDHRIGGSVSVLSCCECTFQKRLYSQRT